MAVEAQAADVLELLLRAGADPTARMYGGRTPLGSATLRPNPILARLLRAHGAPEPEDEDEKPGPCSSSSSDSDSGDEGVSQEERRVAQLGGQGKRAGQKGENRRLAAHGDRPWAAAIREPRQRCQ